MQCVRCTSQDVELYVFYLFILITSKEAFFEIHAFQVKGTDKQEEILGRGFIEDKLCELGLGEVTMIFYSVPHFLPH